MWQFNEFLSLFIERRLSQADTDKNDVGAKVASAQK
jgi:hypothetical protein